MLLLVVGSTNYQTYQTVGEANSRSGKSDFANVNEIAIRLHCREQMLNSTAITSNLHQDKKASDSVRITGPLHLNKD